MMKKDFFLIGGAALLGSVAFFYFWNKKQQTANGAINESSTPISTGNNFFDNALLETNLMIKSVMNAGIKNNNPLNIIWTENSRKNPWVGQVGESGRFVVFSDPVYGFRAAARLLKNYNAAGVKTIQQIVSKWAPESDGNNPRAYISFVSSKMGLPPSVPIFAQQYPALLQAMAKMETGKLWDINLIIKGVELS